MEHTYEEIIKLNQVWHLMHLRCYRKSAQNYHRYGARGIYVCDAWHDRDTFITWALANGYQHGLELDREDNDGPYSPDNCQFLTHTDNMRKTSATRWVTAWGETKALMAWTEDGRCKTTRETLGDRLDRDWEPELAISTPTRTQKRRPQKSMNISAFGEERTLLGWYNDDRCSVSYHCLLNRIQRDWDVEEAITAPARK